MSEPTVSLLRKHKLFEHFDEETLRYVAARARTIEIEERAIVWRQGARADKLLLLTKGRCKLRRLTQTRETIVDMVLVGELAGELAFALDVAYSTDLVALRKSQALVIPTSVLRSALTTRPDATAAIAMSLARRLLRVYRQLEDLDGGNVEARLARVLLRLIERVGEPFLGGILVPVKLRRRELATMAATTLESVSRALNRWQKQGIVVLQPHGFVIKDKRALERLAGAPVIAFDARQYPSPRRSLR